MKQFLNPLFLYNQQINQKLAERFVTYGFQLDSDSCSKLANHILNAHQIWLDRINNTSSIKSPWEIFPLETFPERNQKLHDQTFALLETCNFDQMIAYRNSKGLNFEKRISDILIHVVNHYTYHRGQIAMLMRTNGLEPVPSDYIHWAK